MHNFASTFFDLAFVTGENMEAIKPKYGSLTGNQLKIIALLAMTCDHIGKQLFPQITILQIFGRLAFPIFAYMIAEGCVYTKSKKKYLLSMTGLAAMCQIVYFVAMGSLYQCVLVTFSFSIALIFLLDYAKKIKKFLSYIGCVLGFIVTAFVCIVLPWILRNTDFVIDYGFWGVLLPVFVYLGKTKTAKLILTSVILLMLGIWMGGLQWYALFVPILMIFYSGKRGMMKLKHLFYIYYPLHLVGIYLLGLVVF